MQNTQHFKKAVTLQNAQQMLQYLENYYDGQFVKVCGKLTYQIDQKNNTIQSMKNQIIKYQQEVQILHKSQTNIENDIKQFTIEKEKIQLDKVAYCQDLFEELFKFSEKNSFQNVVKMFISSYPQNPKQSSQSLLLFSKSYQSKGLSKQVQRIVNKIYEEYQKLTILYQPRIKGINGNLLSAKKQKINVVNQREKLERKMITLRIDEQIQLNQLKYLQNTIQQKFIQAKQFIKRQAVLLTQQYNGQKSQQSLMQFCKLMQKQFLERVDRYVQCLKIMGEIVQFNQFMPQICNKYSDQKQLLENISTSRTFQQTKQITNQLTPRIHTYKVYKRNIIGNIQLSAFKDNNLSQMQIHPKQIIFKKKYRVDKIRIDNITCIKKLKNKLIIQMKKGKILVQPFSIQKFKEIVQELIEKIDIS